MGHRYRRRSFSSWAFWTTLLIGGTLYAAHRFDWFPIGFLSSASAPQSEQDAKAEPEPEIVPSPPDGKVEVAENPTGPQSEPQPTEIEDSAAHTETKARLLVQRAESTAPKQHANAAIPHTVQQANIDASEVSQSPFDADTPAEKPTSKGQIRQTSNEVEERDPPLVVDPELAVQLEKIDGYLHDDNLLRAHRELSTIYWSKPQWRATIRERIEKTAGAIYFDPQVHFLEAYVVQPNDQFAQFSKRYNVPWQYLAKLNRIDPKRIRAGQRIKVIKGPFSAIVELNNYLLTVHAYGYYVRAYPIGIGKDNATPIGKFTVNNKVSNPQYTDPQGQVIDADDPNNPLGERWLDLGDGYGIHGTIDANSIGKAASRGCIRLRNKDVEEVYDMLGVGSEVTIRR